MWYLLFFFKKSRPNKIDYHLTNINDKYLDRSKSSKNTETVLTSLVYQKNGRDKIQKL